MFKNIILSILCVFCINFTAKAQFSMDDDSLFTGGWVAPFVDLNTHTFIRNTTASSDTIIWNRYIEVVPSTWSSAVCDINLCWPVTKNTAEFVLAPNASGELSFHFYPGSNSGTGKMVVRFSRKADPNFYIDVFVNCQAYGLGINSVNKSIFQVYPNPATDMITIGDGSVKVGQYDISNMMGESVLANTFSGTQQVDVSTLAKGVYIVTLKNGDMVSSGKMVIE